MTENTGRALIAISHFQQGWGGAPESMRLLARGLSDKLSIDALDEHGFYENCGRSELPNEPDPKQERDWSYDYFLIAGPWQNPLRLVSILRKLPNECRKIYLPRGGLCRVEFLAFRKALKAIPYFYLVERWLISICDSVVYSSHLERSETERALNVKSNTSFVIPDVVESVDDFLEVPKYLAPNQNQLINIALFGEVHPRKNIHIGIDAALIASKKRAHSSRIIVGGGVHQSGADYYAWLQSKYSDEVSKGLVQFVGAIAHSHRAAFLGDADVLLVPSAFESFGLTAVEGLNRQCQVVISKNCGVTEWIPASTPGLFVCDRPEAAELVEKIIEAFESTSQRVVPNGPAVGKAINAIALNEWHKLINASHDSAICSDLYPPKPALKIWRPSS
jgi:glycosyltransferase involved in cell wall biosynthesis